MSKPVQVGIVNYGMGNLKSVLNALDSFGVEALLVERPQEFSGCSHVIIPGVGAYSEAMKNIRSRGLEEPIRRHVKDGRPLLGICLGMQILSDEGDEVVLTQGLGLIPGRVQRLTTPLRIPHVGWNDIVVRTEHPVFAGLRKGVDYYFVHSYCFHPARAGDILADVDYGQTIACAVTDGGGVIGVQFHPEKSQENGLKLLENFCAWDGSRHA